jgi:hypothetical protein
VEAKSRTRREKREEGEEGTVRQGKRIGRRERGKKTQRGDSIGESPGDYKSNPLRLKLGEMSKKQGGGADPNQFSRADYLARSGGSFVCLVAYFCGW